MNHLKRLLVLVVLVAGWGWVEFFSQSRAIVTDLDQVLPPQSAAISQVQSELAAAAGNKVLLAIYATHLEVLEDVVDAILPELEAAQWQLDRQSESDFMAFTQGIADHPGRFQFLSQSDSKLLASGNVDELDRSLKDFLFGLPTDVRIQPFARDPYNLLGRSLGAWMPQVSDTVVFNGDYFEGERNGRQIAVLPLSPISKRLDFDELITDRAMFTELEARTEARFGVEIVTAGALFHIAKASADARREITIFSAISIVGILILFLTTFRGARALLFVLSSVGVGCVGAIGVASLLFGQLHAIAMVFGCSLIGVGVDYAFHYLCLGSRDHLDALRRASGLALLSTGTAYLCLLQSSIPVVAQVAVLSSAGLATAWLFVVVLYPIVFATAQPTHLSLMSRTAGYLSRAPWAGTAGGVLAAIVVIVSLSLGFLSFKLEFNQTVTSLYQADESAIQSDQRVAELMSGFSPVRFFIVSGDNVEQVLERMETLRPQLTASIEQGLIQGFQLISDLVPSRTTRQSNAQLAASLYGDAGHIFSQVEIAAEARKALHAEVEASLAGELDSDQIDHLGRTYFPHLWLGELDGQYRATIPLLAPSAELATAFPATGVGVEYVDQTAGWAVSLADATRQAFWYFLLVAGVVCVLLLTVFRTLRSLTVLLMPAVSGLVVLVVLTALGHPISLFHVFGLYLIVGLGLDYGVFIYRDVGSTTACMTAVLLSALTTAMAFGMLSQSATPMIAAFGLTVLCGTILNLFLVPAIRVFRDRAQN